jgi:hypothetical protein
LFCFAQDNGHTQTSAKRIITLNRPLLFPEKEAKSVCSASQKTVGYPNLGEADRRDYSSNSILLFPEKEAKSVCSASQKTVGSPNLGEADPGGLGACPQKTN